MLFLQSWIGRICAASILVAVIGALVPKNSAGKIVCLIGAVIMIFVLVSPFKKFDVLQLASYSHEYEEKLREKVENMQAMNEKEENAIIEARLKSYILQRTEQMGIRCEVSIYCKEKTPYTAVVVTEDKNNSGAIKKMIESECGIKDVSFSYRKV